MALRLTSNLLLPLLLTAFVLFVPATAIISSVPCLHIGTPISTQTTCH